MKANKLVIITGMSGSGKSTALDAFEDMGYFCVDNLPAPLMANFTDFLQELPEAWSTEHPCTRGIAAAGECPKSEQNFALLMDCRERGAFPLVRVAIERLRAAGTEVTLLFCDSQDEVLTRRYQETRRPHPLLVVGEKGGAGTIAGALARERELLADFRGAADLIVDSSGFSPHDLRKFIQNYSGQVPALEIMIQSFGYKYGMPQDVDLVADVRFLPNPHFVPTLRAFTGADPRIVEYVFQSPDANEFVRQYLSLLQFLIPRYQKEGKRYLKIAIGCTGGRHRSVAIVNRLAESLQQAGQKMAIAHRDVERAG